MRRLLWRVAVSPVLVGSLIAQGPTFDVASIRESPPTGGKSFIGPQPGGRWVATNVELDEILVYLYPQYSWYAVDFGGPAWTTRVAFDVSGVADGNPSRELREEMARQLLKDRFGLQFHIEKREMDVYAMVVARPGLGRGLTPATFDCTAVFAARARGETPPPIPPPSGDKPTCGFSTPFEDGVIRVLGGGMTMDRIAAFMEGFRTAPERRPIIDRTGLTGRYDIDMKFSLSGALSVNASIPKEPMLHEAMEDYLGLRLEPRRELREVLIIDRVTMQPRTEASSRVRRWSIDQA